MSNSLSFWLISFHFDISWDSDSYLIFPRVVSYSSELYGLRGFSMYTNRQFSNSDCTGIISEIIYMKYA